MKIQILILGFKALSISSPLHFKIIFERYKFVLTLLSSVVMWNFSTTSPSRRMDASSGVFETSHFFILYHCLAFGERKRKEPNT